jgi:hypothetical protein
MQYSRSGRYCQRHPKCENAKADANASNTIFNAQTFANVEGSVGKQTTENTHSPHTIKL